MLSFSAISGVVVRRLFSIIAFILTSSTSVGRPERGARFWCGKAGNFSEVDLGVQDKID